MHCPPVPAPSSAALPCPASARATQHLKATAVTGASGCPTHSGSAEKVAQEGGGSSEVWPEVGQPLQDHPPLSGP